MVKILEIRTGEDLECPLARATGELADREIPAFGSSDCDCPSHLAFFADNPLKREDFVEMILRFRHQLWREKP